MPSGTDIGLVDSLGRVLGRGHIMDQRRAIGVIGQRPDVGEPLSVPERLESAPVRHMRPRRHRRRPRWMGLGIGQHPIRTTGDPALISTDPALIPAGPALISTEFYRIRSRLT